MTHLDLDALADVLAGQVSDHTHLDTCASCQARLAELNGSLPLVAASLAAVQPPVEPTELGVRIADALTAERAPSGGTIVPLRATSRVRWMPALAGLAAACVLVTGALLFSQRPNSSNNTTASRDQGSVATSNTGNRYSTEAASYAAALPGLLQGGAQRTSVTQSFPKGATPAPETATDATLAAPSGGVDPLAALRTTDGLASCLAELSDPTDPGFPLALDYAEFNGAPALVVVFATAKPDKVDVFVVGPGCRQGESALLFFIRVAKP